MPPAVQESRETGDLEGLDRIYVVSFLRLKLIVLRVSVFRGWAFAPKTFQLQQSDRHPETTAMQCLHGLLDSIFLD